MPEVGQQQEAALEVLREHLRRVHARVAQQRGDVHERPAVLLRRRRVHRDQRRRAGRERVRRLQRHAEIAAKARIVRRRRKRERAASASTCASQSASAARRGVGGREDSSDEVRLRPANAGYSPGGIPAAAVPTALPHRASRKRRARMRHFSKPVASALMKSRSFRCPCWSRRSARRCATARGCGGRRPAGPAAEALARDRDVRSSARSPPPGSPGAPAAATAPRMLTPLPGVKRAATPQRAPTRRERRRR